MEDKYVYVPDPNERDIECIPMEMGDWDKLKKLVAEKDARIVELEKELAVMEGSQEHCRREIERIIMIEGYEGIEDLKWLINAIENELRTHEEGRKGE